MGRTETNINWSLLGAARFVLAIIVLTSHLSYFQGNALTRLVEMLDSKAAVLGFLVISGFSVTSSFDRRHDGFLKRRLLRIYPAYIFAIAISIALQIGVGPYHANGIFFEGSGWIEVVGNILLLQMYAVKALNFNPVLWSLSIEVSYYLLLHVLGRPDPRLMFIAIAVSIVYFVLPHDLSGSKAYQAFEKLNMVRCLWPFLIGVALSRYPSTKLYLSAAVLGTAATLLSDWTPYPLQFVTYLLTIAAIYVAQRGWFRQSIVMDRLGDISYPLYLVHIPTGIFLAAVLGITSPLIITFSAIALASFVAFVIEKPFRDALVKLGSFRIQRERSIA